MHYVQILPRLDALWKVESITKWVYSFSNCGRWGYKSILGDLVRKTLKKGEYNQKFGVHE